MIGKKKLVFLFVYILLPFSQINAQCRILMEKEGGVFKIPCTVNGAKMKFVFDTGAAKVNLSLSMAEYLYENGYLTKDDIIGKSTSTTASGEIVDNLDIIIRDIEISGLHLKNVHAWVSKSLNAPLLLGQSAIQKLGPVTIDGNYLIINNIARKLSSSEVQDLRNTIVGHINKKEYLDAIKWLIKLDEGYGLEFQDYQALISSYYYTERYVDCSETCRRLVNDNKINISHKDYVVAYKFMSDSYYKSKEYKEAIEAGKQGLNNCSKDDGQNKAILCYIIGASYDKIRNQEKCLDYYHLGLETLTDLHDITNEDFFSGNFQNNEINTFLLLLGKNYMSHGDSANGSLYFAIGAAAGDSECLRYCKLYHINYKKVCKNIIDFTKGKK